MLKSMWVGGPTIMKPINAIAATTDSALTARLAAVERMQSETDRLANFQKEVMKRILLLSGTEVGTVKPEWKWYATPTLKVEMIFYSKEVEIAFCEDSIILTDLSSDEMSESMIDRNAYNGKYEFDQYRSDYIDGNTPAAIFQLLDEMEKMASELFAGEHFVLPVEIRSDDAIIATNGPEIWFESGDGKTAIIAKNTLTGICWYDTSFVPSEMISALKKFIEG
jgi:hypothetical protein